MKNLLNHFLLELRSENVTRKHDIIKKAQSICVSDNGNPFTMLMTRYLNIYTIHRTLVFSPSIESACFFLLEIRYT